MGNCYQREFFAGDHIHTIITFYNIEEPQQKYHFGTVSNRLLGALRCLLGSHFSLCFSCGSSHLVRIMVSKPNDESSHETNKSRIRLMIGLNALFYSSTLYQHSWWYFKNYFESYRHLSFPATSAAVLSE